MADENELIVSGPETPITPSPPPAEVVGTQPEVAEGKRIDQVPDPAQLQAEIDRLEKVRKEAEEKAVYWRQQKAKERADYFKSRGEEQRQPTPQVDNLGIGPAPQQSKFDDYQKFLDAKLDWTVKKAKAEWDADQRRKETDAENQKRMIVIQEKIGEGFKKYEDFGEVALDPTVPITPTIMEVLAETENPSDVAYYLGKNRSEAIQISRMTPIQAAKAIARIEMTIKQAGEQPLPPGAKKIIPNAPPPIKPIGSGPSVERDLEKMPQKDFEAEMERRTGKRF